MIKISYISDYLSEGKFKFIKQKSENEVVVTSPYIFLGQDIVEFSDINKIFYLLTKVKY